MSDNPMVNRNHGGSSTRAVKIACLMTMLLGCSITLSQYQSYMIADIWCMDTGTEKMVMIQLDETMSEPTDITCMEAADLFHTITTQGYKLLVKPYRAGGWIPSRVNPMDETWTRHLVEGKNSIERPPRTPRQSRKEKSGVIIKVIPDGREKKEMPERGRQKDAKEITITIK
ncbi:MAG: hypothetical protein JRJ14_10395 [Deltaproteobacteria bacterium]|nr:hypothetical protein [Deltaproteobacteria bacterium]